MIPATGGVWRGARTADSRLDYWTATGRSVSLSYYRTQTENIKHFEERVVSECFQMDSSNSSFTTKSCACASITFLAGIISWSVYSPAFYSPHWGTCLLFPFLTRNMLLHSRICRTTPVIMRNDIPHVFPRVAI
jgi:hypothetical protein